MKKNWILMIFVALITVVAVAIAIPTMKFNVLGFEIDIRGIDPKDFNSTIVTEYFGFTDSMDFNGGSIVTLNVDLSKVATDNVEQEFNRVVSTLYWRLANANITDFKLNTVRSTDLAQNKITLKFANSIDVYVIQLLLQTGKFEFALVERAEPNTITPLEISNADIESVKIVSDASCYYASTEGPINYCIMVTIKQDKRIEMLAALQTAVQGEQVIGGLIDGQQIAYQSPNQVINPSDPGKEIVLAPSPLFGNKQMIVSILASLIRNDELPATVYVVGYSQMQPTLGENTLQTLKIAEILAVVAVIILVKIFFRMSTRLIIVLYAVFFVWGIALFKVLNLILNLSFVIGFTVATGLFFASLMIAQIKIHEMQTGGVKPAELTNLTNWVTNRFRNLTLMLLVMNLCLTYVGTVFINSVFMGLGAGMIIGLLVYILAFKAIVPFIYLKKGGSK